MPYLPRLVFDPYTITVVVLAVKVIAIIAYKADNVTVKVTSTRMILHSYRLSDCKN